MQNFEKEMFRAVVRIPAVPIELDCMFSISATLFENMQQLESLLPDEIRAFFVLHEGNLFVEESSGRILNPFISCRRFSFWEGVTFLIC